MPPEKKSKVWLFFVAVCVLQLGAWTAWFIIAKRNPVQEVPLVKTR